MAKYSLLQELCAIHAPSGNESALTSFIINYVNKNGSNWRRKPRVYSGVGFQDCVILVFGTPRTVMYAHMDSVGFTVGYNKNLIPIGSPQAEDGVKLTGTDSIGEITCTLHTQLVEKTDEDGEKYTEKTIEYSNSREIERGTSLTYSPKYSEDDEFIQSCYLDNRAGVWAALQVAETLEHGVIAFSTWEEHKGGSIQFLHRFLYKKYHIRQALIADITWVTQGILAGQGCAISLRDSYIPRRSYVNRIVEIAKRSRIPYQLEVESAGGSDGGYLQQSAYAVDWCFVGAPESHAHTNHEKVHKADLESMVLLYKALMKEL